MAALVKALDAIEKFFIQTTGTAPQRIDHDEKNTFKVQLNQHQKQFFEQNPFMLPENSKWLKDEWIEIELNEIPLQPKTEGTIRFIANVKNFLIFILLLIVLWIFWSFDPPTEDL